MNMTLSQQEFDLIHAIAQRAEKLGLTTIEQRITTMMDLSVTHLNGCPLHLAELLDGEAQDFAHDLGGIRRHLNRETGKLEDFFLPRFAAHQEA